MARSRQALLVWLLAGGSAFVALAVALGPEPCRKPGWAGVLWWIAWLLAGLLTTVAVMLSASRFRIGMVPLALLAGGGVVFAIFALTMMNWVSHCTN